MVVLPVTFIQSVFRVTSRQEHHLAYCHGPLVLHNKVSMDCERILYQVLQLLLRMVQQQRHAELQRTATCFKALVADGKDKAISISISMNQQFWNQINSKNIPETEELKEMIDQVHRETNISNFDSACPTGTTARILLLP
jgi:hypothetical protein